MLVQHEAGRQAWHALEQQLHARTLTLREVLAAQALMIKCTMDEADAFLAAQTRFDPAFAGFVRECRAQGWPLTILSSGVAPLIERALRRNAIDGVEVRANEVDVRSDGWIMRFRDGSDNGHDKAADVREAKARGSTTVYIGDGFSDFEAALEADLRFAKEDHALVRYLRECDVPFTEFSSFQQVSQALLSQ